MGYTLADLSAMLKMNEIEIARTYDLDLPRDGQARRSHLRIIQ